MDANGRREFLAKLSELAWRDNNKLSRYGQCCSPRLVLIQQDCASVWKRASVCAILFRSRTKLETLSNRPGESFDDKKHAKNFWQNIRKLITNKNFLLLRRCWLVVAHHTFYVICGLIATLKKAYFRQTTARDSSYQRVRNYREKKLVVFPNKAADWCLSQCVSCYATSNLFPANNLAYQFDHEQGQCFAMLQKLFSEIWFQLLFRAPSGAFMKLHSWK